MELKKRLPLTPAHGGGKEILDHLLGASVMVKRMRSLDVRAVRTSSQLPSACVFFTKLNAADERRFMIPQVVESLVFDFDAGVAHVWADVFFWCPPGPPAQFRVFHPGRVTGQLQRFSMALDDPRQHLLNKLYAGRIGEDTQDAAYVLFHRRTNCVGKAETADRVSLAGPGRCFARGPGAVPLQNEMEGIPGRAAFSSFVVPPNQCEEAEDGDLTIFRLELTVEGQDFVHLVSSRAAFRVNSHARMMDDIETLELPECDPQYRTFYRTHVKPGGTLIVPEFYDIVIFQRVPNASAVRLAPETQNLGIVSAPVPEDVAGQALWFFGRDDFFIELCCPAKASTRHAAHVST